jgi:putative glutamine amidotransferase
VERDLTELLVIQEVFRQRKPLLAICRGHQILNVALGGTLLLDIPKQRPHALDHNQPDRKDEAVHKVALTPGSLIHKMCGASSLGVNSSHHQAVDRVARPLRATAVSADGIVEAMELSREGVGWLPFLLAVQFHPERLRTRDPAFLELFRGLVGACRGKRK